VHAHPTTASRASTWEHLPSSDIQVTNLDDLWLTQWCAAVMSSHLLQCTKVPYSDGTLSIYPNCGYWFDFMGPGYLTYGNLRLLPYYNCAINFILLSSGSMAIQKNHFPFSSLRLQVLMSSMTKVPSLAARKLYSSKNDSRNMSLETVQFGYCCFWRSFNDQIGGTQEFFNMCKHLSEVPSGPRLF
jgi:hypothetical protein